MKRYIKSFESFDDVNKVIDVTDTIDVDKLKSIKDERDYIKVGDVVIATYFGGGFNTYEFEVEYNDIDENDDLRNLGNSDGNSYFSIGDAYHVVRKSSYE